MNLIFLYGPPAVGKLTIASLLSQHTGIPLFHNHLTRDLVKDIYGDALKKHYDLVDTLRLNVLDYCAAHGTDLIFTYVYEGADDDVNVRAFIDVIERHNGSVVFVELTADRSDLIERVGNVSRQQHQKLIDPTILTDITEDMTKFSIPFVDALQINTSQLSAVEAAEVIARHLGYE